jgi:hypothetical protein
LLSQSCVFDIIVDLENVLKVEIEDFKVVYAVLRHSAQHWCMFPAVKLHNTTNLADSKGISLVAGGEEGQEKKQGPTYSMVIGSTCKPYPGAVWMH